MRKKFRSRKLSRRRNTSRRKDSFKRKSKMMKGGANNAHYKFYGKEYPISPISITTECIPQDERVPYIAEDGEEDAPKPGFRGKFGPAGRITQHYDIVVKAHYNSSINKYEYSSYAQYRDWNGIGEPFRAPLHRKKYYKIGSADNGNTWSEITNGKPRKERSEAYIMKRSKEISTQSRFAREPGGSSALPSFLKSDMGSRGGGMEQVMAKMVAIRNVVTLQQTVNPNWPIKDPVKMY